MHAMRQRFSPGGPARFRLDRNLRSQKQTRKKERRPAAFEKTVRWARLLGGVAGQTCGEAQQQRALFGIHFGQVPLELAKFRRFFFGVAPEALVVVGDEFARLGGFVAFVHHFVERHVESARPLFESLDGRDGVTVFDAGDVAAEKPGGFLDVALAEILFFAKRFEALSYLHRKRLQHSGG